MGLREQISLCLSLLVLFGAFGQVLAQGGAPKFEVDPTWPKPLPENWVTGQVSGVCADNRDHVFIVNRSNITAKEHARLHWRKSGNVSVIVPITVLRAPDGSTPIIIPESTATSGRPPVRIPADKTGVATDRRYGCDA